MIGIVDYGVGNIAAFANIYKRLNIPYKIVRIESDFKNLTKIILPGVGAFDHTIQKLNASGLREQLEDLVLVKKIPVLGICVGMQLFAESSEEGSLPGLGWIKGKVRSLNKLSENFALPLPHMGWNQIIPHHVSHPLFNGLDEIARFYFLHSFYFECADNAHCIAKTDYTDLFASVLQSGHIFGIQCHPEKSHSNGITFLKNFFEM